MIIDPLILSGLSNVWQISYAAAGMPGPEVQSHDGIAACSRGDLLLVVYQKAARVQRTSWLFDRLDELAARCPESVLVLMIILPECDPPDGATRAENNELLKAAVVRTVMRTMFLLQGRSRDHSVSSTLEDGIRLVLEAASPKTPSARAIRADLRAIYAALDVPLAAEQVQAT